MLVIAFLDQLLPTVIRVFILGPSHFSALDQNCALTTCTHLQTPLGQLTVDTQTVEELLKLEGFREFPIDDDEQEHSVAMHLPYVFKAFESNKDIKVVPIVVGSLDPGREAHFGQLLKDHLLNPENFFIISSDFCHWGQRFHYVNYDESFEEIHKYIEHLDRDGMKIIETIEPALFTKYLQKTKNTICGRHPIGVLLNALKLLKNGGRMKLEFITYAQSEHCKKMTDSSVSYATAVIQLE
ncbi:hypothetical protein Ciccas_001903 [Cichlidogyrus casuarinus]|uniref:Protein MEMO1 n=1 Tax=Cichlidogyrus casuarinus TaxID=1844966 RepID=A0ABD2QJ01_9PLAT